MGVSAHAEVFVSGPLLADVVLVGEFDEGAGRIDRFILETDRFISEIGRFMRRI